MILTPDDAALVQHVLSQHLQRLRACLRRPDLQPAMEVRIEKQMLRTLDILNRLGSSDLLRMFHHDENQSHNNQ